MTAPPYPADTRAKGWRFELDYEQIDQSDTWDLAAEIPMAQHALLMMWLVAWRQDPCGSLPNDEGVIRAKCRIPADVWAHCHHLLMRGWWLADDGRLYHDTISKRVLAMLEKRSKDAKRAARRRHPEEEPVTPAVSHGKPVAVSSESHEVTRDSRATNAGVRPEFDTKHQAPTSSNEEVEAPLALVGRPPRSGKCGKQKPIQPPPNIADLVAVGFDPDIAAEFIAYKAGKKAPLTDRAWTAHLRECAVAGWIPQDAAVRTMEKEWRGFEARYVSADSQLNGETAWQRNQRERVAEMTGGLVSAKPPGYTPSTPATFNGWTLENEEGNDARPPPLRLD